MFRAADNQQAGAATSTSSTLRGLTESNTSAAQLGLPTKQQRLTAVSAEISSLQAAATAATGASAAPATGSTASSSSLAARPQSVQHSIYEYGSGPDESAQLRWTMTHMVQELKRFKAQTAGNHERAPVLADTTLCQTHTSCIGNAPPLDLLCCLSQWWIQQCGRALPCFAPRILAFLNTSLYHEHQLTVAEFSAYHLRSVIQHLDGLTIARTTKLTTGCKEHTEDELLEAPADTPNAVETEFHGGEGVDPDEPEDELVDAAERSSPLFWRLERQAAVQRLDSS